MASPMLSIVVTSLVTLLVAFLTIWSLRTLIRRRPTSLNEARPFVIFLALSGALAIYLVLVAAGRTNTAPPDSGPLDVFSFAFYRFHYFWITAIWPWVLALVLIFLGSFRASRRFPRAQVIASWALPLILLPLFVLSGAFNHGDFYRTTMERRENAIHCLLAEVNKQDSDFFCIETDIEPIGPGFLAGVDAGASYGRLIRPMQTPLGTDSPAPLLRLSARPNAISAQNTKLIRKTDGTFTSSGGNDPMLLIDVGKPIAMAKCERLEVTVSLRVAKQDLAILFFRHPKQAAFTAAELKPAEVPASTEFTTISFFPMSDVGFADQLRLDPVGTTEPFEMKDLEVRCRRTLE